MKPELKKLLVLNLPYLLFVYLLPNAGRRTVCRRARMLRPSCCT